MFHVPPFNTKLDMLYDASHVGSKAVREFIEKFQPLLTLHGHIHESPRMSGQFNEMIGRTMSINPGSENMVSVGLNDLKSLKLIKFA